MCIRDRFLRRKAQKITPARAGAGEGLFFPEIVKDSDRWPTIVFGFQIPAFDRFGDAEVQRFAFQILVDILIGHPQRHFIRQGGAIVFQIGRCV